MYSAMVETHRLRESLADADMKLHENRAAIAGGLAAVESLGSFAYPPFLAAAIISSVVALWELHLKHEASSIGKKEKILFKRSGGDGK